MIGRAEQIRIEVMGLLEGPLKDMGFELVELEYLSGQGRWILRLYIDRAGGVTVEDCARVSRELGAFLDVKDVIPHRHVLEVSSPGLNRPLRKGDHFLREIGKKIRVRLRESQEGQRNFNGFLKGFDGEVLVMDTDKGEVSLPLSQVEKANVVYDFENP